MNSHLGYKIPSRYHFQAVNISIDKLLNPTTTILKSTKSNKLSKVLDEGTIDSVFKKITKLYKNFCLNYINEEQLILEFPGLSKESQKLIINAIKSNKSKILEAQMILLNDPSEKTMHYFDWDVSSILSSSSLEGQKKVLMNLALTCQDEVSHFELTTDNVEKLIKLLE